MRTRSRLAALALAAAGGMGCVSYQIPAPATTYNPYGNVALRVYSPQPAAGQSNDIHVYHHGAPGQPGQQPNWTDDARALSNGLDGLTDSMRRFGEMQQQNTDFLRGVNDWMKPAADNAARQTQLMLQQEELRRQQEEAERRRRMQQYPNGVRRP